MAAVVADGPPDQCPPAQPHRLGAPHTPASRRGVAATALLASALLAGTAVVPAGVASAAPTVDEIAPPLPVVVPAPSNWQPKYPFPFDQLRDSVTNADITAEREMCQWYSTQYDDLMTEIDRFDNNLIASNGDYGVDNNNELADAVTANIDRAVAFLTPRVQALTQVTNHFGDQSYSIYQGQSFHLLWEHLSNVSAGIRGRQPAWFYGPSVQRALRWGSRINRSHVCRS